jgi:acyl dehydratase
MRVGDRASRSRTVGARDIGLFTELPGDTNPRHHDEELARRSRFGGIVVQGGVTSGLLNALVAARAGVTSVRADKPVTGLDTTITNQDGVVVLDGTAVVRRDPVVAAAGVPAPQREQARS